MSTITRNAALTVTARSLVVVLRMRPSVAPLVEGHFAAVADRTAFRARPRVRCALGYDTWLAGGTLVD